MTIRNGPEASKRDCTEHRSVSDDRYHDRRDGAIEKPEGADWCFLPDANEWQKGLPAGMTVDDLDLFFALEVESNPTQCRLLL